MGILRIVVAMPVEARIFIDHYRLRADESVSGGARLYRGTAEGHEVLVLVSGLGKIAMASSVGYLAALEPATSVWINAGIAGHGRLAVGEVVMAHSVRDRATGETLYPPLVVTPPVATTALTTVDHPETDYDDDCAYDMEASAFIMAARRFTTAELVHSVKVISDGPESSLEKLDRASIRAFVVRLLEPTLELANALLPLSEELQNVEGPPRGEDELLDRWHFTLSDRRALRRELRRRDVLVPETELPRDLFVGVQRGRQAIQRLRIFLDAQAVGDQGRLP